jgi:hypothetical protein
MTTEKHDPWALLREAKRLIAANRLMLGHYSGVREVGSLEDSIDAALAGRAEGSTEGVVEWEERQGSYIHDDGVNELRVYLWGDEWHWHTVVEYRANGICTTEAEAKSAAIAAARGMR